MHRRERSSSPPSGTRTTYKWITTYIEDNSSDPQTTWGIQFCLRPSAHQMKGGGVWWKERKSVDQQNGEANGHTRMEDDQFSEPGRSAADAGQRVWRDIFGTCNLNFIRVYEARRQRKPELLQVFEDEDEEESFYCIAWTFNASRKNEWWICTAGKKGVVRVINVQKNRLEKTLTGHGEAINDLKVHPRDPSLIVTASKDESLRLWNLRTGSTVAVFAGLKGHRGEVVSLDFDRKGDRIASCGIDNSIRIWEICEDEKVLEAIEESHKAADLGVTDIYIYRDETGARKRTTVPILQFPSFVTRKVHKHYVDCVMWVGDLLLSKSVHNRIYLWEPGADRESLASPATDYTLLEEYSMDACNVWYIRFALDRQRRTIACGNEKGVVYVFRLDEIPSKPMCMVQPKDKIRMAGTSSFVRQCAFSEDGSILLSVDDSACIAQFERTEIPDT